MGKGNFFAMISRMQYIDRWALMRNTRQENLSEHSLMAAVIAHALCVIGNRRLHKNLDGNRAAVLALYHDAEEILTGDLPSPTAPPPGCAFHTRCPYATDRCRTEAPVLREHSAGHWAACHLAV